MADLSKVICKMLQWSEKAARDQIEFARANPQFDEAKYTPERIDEARRMYEMGYMSAFRDLRLHGAINLDKLS